ncbi:MAG: hypothetical protein K2N84_05775 [Clostridia bacterium]|nr:hypothetical protein [Clostridia bacterium]
MEEENKTENPEAQAAAAPATGEAQSTAQANLGKFKSVDALMRAYKELEAEFTRRSQKLKALEESAPQSGNADLGSATRKSETVAEDIPPAQKVPLMTDGGAGVTAPARKPKNIREAGDMALGYLRNQKF